MRKSDLFIAFFSLLLLFVVLLYACTGIGQQEATSLLREEADMVRRWGLTDLCLFTEARYTRHPSQADLHSAFQDHPFALEHFPSGSLIMPPELLRRQHGHVAQ